MTIRCFLKLSQYDNYILIYRKLYYKWLKTYDIKLVYEIYVKFHFMIGLNRSIFKGANNFNYVMIIASRDGHIDIVKLMIDYGANNFDLAMNNASYNGHIDIVKLMIDNGANNFNWVMNNASRCGHIDIVKLMIDYGANDWKMAMKNASLGGHIDIYNYLKDKRDGVI